MLHGILAGERRRDSLRSSLKNRRSYRADQGAADSE
jgi:hypothetical protein